MTWNEGYRKFLVNVRSLYEPSEADAVSALLFENFAGMTRADIIRQGTEEIPGEILPRLQDAFEKVFNGHPVQYVIGRAWFRGMELLVDPAVLIPRPETEELVELFLDRKREDGASVLDIGTGSGCIAISIKKEWPGCRVTAIDSSSDALHTAKKNSERLGTDIDFREMDFLDEKKWKTLDIYDAIISNPPYIPIQEKEKLAPHVRDREPHSALFPPGEDVLIFYRKIAAFGREHLSPQGIILLELHSELAGGTQKIFKGSGYTAEIRSDMFGKERMLIATRNP
jgi:release factor glutamine methyltransferase